VNYVNIMLAYLDQSAELFLIDED